MNSTNSNTNQTKKQQRKKRRVSHVTIQFCDQRSIYIALLQLGDAIADGDRGRAAEMYAKVMKELPVNDEAVDQARYIVQMEKEQEATRAKARNAQEQALKSFEDLLVQLSQRDIKEIARLLELPAPVKERRFEDLTDAEQIAELASLWN